MQRIVRGLTVALGCIGSASAIASVGLSSFTVIPNPTPPAPTLTTEGLLPLTPPRPSTIPTGSVLCGIDSIFANGFEARSFTSVTQLIGGIASPGLIQDITGPLTSVTITSPSGTTSDPTVDVMGTFTGPANTGVTVNGMSGYTAGSRFLVPDVPLNVGSNSLNVVVSTLTGLTATTSGSITRGGSASAIAMRADHAVGYAPFSVAFAYTIGTLPSGKPIQSVAINFKGSGADDYSGSLSGAPKSYRYVQPGLYTARLVVTDTSSNTFTTYRSVLIQDIVAQRGMLCDVYGYLQDRLTAGDSASAPNAFQPSVRSNYQSLFTSFGTHMPAVAQRLGSIVNGLLGTGFAEFIVVRDNADQTRNGFPLRLTQGADGVWRISEM